MPEDPSIESAAAALGVYRQARAAAVAPRPTPAWYPPARGVLAAAAYCWAPFVLTDEHPGLWSTGLFIATALAFLAVHAAAARPGGVLVLPRDHPHRTARLRAQFTGMALWGAAWLLVLPFGWRVGAVVSGLVLGAHLWWTSARERAAAAGR